MKKDLLEQIKKANQNLEDMDFPRHDAIWDRIEDKLDEKEKNRRIIPWKVMVVAASVMVLFIAGIWLIKGAQNSQQATGLDIQEIVTEQIEDLAQQESEMNDQTDEEEIEGDGTNENRIAGISEEQIKSDILIQERESEAQNLNNATLPTIIPVQDSSPSEPTTDSFVGSTNITQAEPIQSATLNQTEPQYLVTETRIREELIIDEALVSESEVFETETAQIFDQVEPVHQTKTEIDMGTITMEPDQNGLDAVVVTGYGKTKTKKFKNRKSRRVVPDNNYEFDEEYLFETEDVLQGRAPGIVVQSGSGQPGTAATVSIRGASSISGGQDPLYILDGHIISQAQFANINPDGISSVQVLKDSGATAIYGNQATNGVVVITTKSGEATFKRAQPKKPMSKAMRKRLANDKMEELTPLIDISNEDYDSFIENQFESPYNQPLSTFSIDVDNASYSNIRRFLQLGQTVPKDAVRIEEMINYFDYEYEQPIENDPLAIHTEYSMAPWNENHKLLKIGLQASDIPKDQLPASNLVFLIDVSGSMSDPNKLPLLKSSFKLLVEELRDDDKVSIVVYAGAAGLVLEPTNDKEEILSALDRLTAGGSTAGGQGIELAYDIASEHFIKEGNNRVILATDGDFNVGASSNSDMEDLIEEKRKSGVFLTCLGYGMGNYKDSKMELLADKGNGNYAYIDNLQEANKFLVQEFSGSMYTLAKDVKLQVEFNPKHVKSYRLIGYENRKLRPEDFSDDTIDAGELGAGHTVTAFYEIIPTGVESEFFTETIDLKYSERVSTSDYSDELATVKFRYKEPDGTSSKEVIQTVPTQAKKLNRTSEDFQFAAAVAWFGLKLRDSQLISNKETSDIVQLAKNGRGDDEHGYRAEFIRLVQTVR